MESSSLSRIDNFTRLGLRSGFDVRPTLLRVLTDLYVQKLTHTPDEERQYTELALRLLDAVDVATRAAVAARLARHLSPPLRVIEHLAGDLPDVAMPVRGHPLLQRGGAAEPPAPPIVPAAKVRDAQARDPDVRDAAIFERGKADEDNDENRQASEGLGADVASELNELFFAATADERRLILLNLEVAVPLPVDRIKLIRDGGVGQRLETAALARDREQFAQHLAHSLQISRAQALRVAGDELGEPIVTAVKALNLPRDVVYRILLFVNTTVGHSVERVHALAALYDEMTTRAAEHMVAIWQAMQRTQRAVARHRPLLWNDEARASARTAAAPARRAPAAHRPSQRRDAS